MPTYATAADVKSNTRNTILAQQVDPIINALIEQAELIIDEYVCFTNTPTDQDLKFPRIGDTGIIKQVKFATIYQVEYMFEVAPDIDHGMSEETGEQNTTGSRYNIISHRAKHLLKNIRQITGKPFTVPSSNYDVTII